MASNQTQKVLPEGTGKAAPIAVGVDLGGTKIQAVALSSLDGELLGQSRRATPTTGSVGAVVAQIVACVDAAIAQAGGAVADVRGLGIGSPGRVDRVTGEVSGAENVAGFAQQQVPLGVLLFEAFKGAFPVRMDNDVRAAVLAELRRGAGRPYRNCIAVWLGTGVGGAVVCDREIFAGAGAAGEIGHTVVKPGGRRCSCGRHGCLEAYAGRACMEAAALRMQRRGRRTRLFEIMRERDRQRLTSGIWARALAEQDPVAEKLLDRAAWALGIAMASAQNLLDSEAIIVGGGLGDRLGEGFRASAEQTMTKHLLNPQAPPALLGTELGDLGGAIGAALLVGPAQPGVTKGAAARRRQSAEGGSAAAAPAAEQDGHLESIRAVKGITRKRQVS